MANLSLRPHLPLLPQTTQPTNRSPRKPRLSQVSSSRTCHPRSNRLTALVQKVNNQPAPDTPFAKVLASEGPLARAVDESTDKVAKVPELFRSVLRECLSPRACGTRDFGDGRDDDVRRSGISPRVGSGFPSPPFPLAVKVDGRCEEGNKGTCDSLDCGMGRVSGVAQKWYQDAV